MKQFKALVRYTAMLFTVAIGLMGVSSIFLPKREVAKPLSPTAQCLAKLPHIISGDALMVTPEIEALTSKIRQMTLARMPKDEIDIVEMQLDLERQRHKISRTQSYCREWAMCFPDKPYGETYDECYSSMK